MPTSPRLSSGVRAVLRVMLQDPDRPFVIQELERESGLPTGPLHDMFERLETLRWLTCESVTRGRPTTHGRPVARCYRMSTFGVAEATRVLAHYDRRQSIRF